MNPLLHTDRRELSGLDTHFQMEMMPDLAKFETERKVRMRWGLCVAVLLFLPSLWLSWYLIFQYEDIDARVYIIAFILPWTFPFIGLALVMVPLQLRLKSYLMDALTSRLGWKHKLREKSKALVKTLSEFDVLPRHSQSRVVDAFEGTHLGRYFELRETILYKRQWWSRYNPLIVVFQGLVVSFQLDRITADTTIISRAKKPSSSRLGRGNYYFSDYEDAQGIVHILSTDYDVLYTVMCVRFRSAIADLEAAFPNTDMACLLSGNQLHVTMKAKNRFEIGSMFDALDNSTHLQKMLDEFGEILQLLDIVLARRRCPKTGEVASPHIMS